MERAEKYKNEFEIEMECIEIGASDPAQKDIRIAIEQMKLDRDTRFTPQCECLAVTKEFAMRKLIRGQVKNTQLFFKVMDAIIETCEQIKFIKSIMKNPIEVFENFKDNEGFICLSDVDNEYGVSQKHLTDYLKDLENEGIISVTKIPDTLAVKVSILDNPHVKMI